MNINFSHFFLQDLEHQVYYISKNKPFAAKKFKKDLLALIKKDLKFPFHFKKSTYFDN